MPLTQNQADRTSYGVLLAEARDATVAAQDAGIGTFHDAQQAADVVADFERFLAIGGRHLSLLYAPGHINRGGLRKAHQVVASRLETLAMERRGDTPWAEAGDRLGLAHDVLATHVDPQGHLRSPEAEALVQPGIQAAAFARVLVMLTEPLAMAPGLLTNARTVQPTRAAPLPRTQASRLRQRAHAAQAALAAAPPLSVASAGVLADLDRLGPTVTKVATDTSCGPEALRTLRQLSHRQRLGDERANAHTLRDLCALGATTCRAVRDQLPLAHTPLERVQRATAVDQLILAEASWRQIEAQLFPRVQGLSKAPGTYRAAVETLVRDVARRPAVAHSVLSALPRLAADAAGTVSALHLRGELVTPSRWPGELSSRWRRLEEHHVQAISAAFTGAGLATRAAYDASHRSPAAPAPRQLPGASPQARRGLDLGATS